MTFVNPWFLAGTALIAVPIVLHLIMRRRPRHFEFPALRLLEKRHETNQRRLRLRHLLLLALRVAAIALLAAALARPSVKLSGSWGSQEAPVAAALVFDTAPRMDYRHENRTRLEAARELGSWLLAQFPADSQIAVLDTRPGPAAFQVDRGAAKHRIERLETAANSQPLVRALDEAVALLGRSDLARREIYLFGDLARAGWPRERAAALRSRLAAMPDVGVYVVDVGVDDPTNSSLGDLRLSAEVISSRTPLRLETEIAHRGLGGERTVEVQILARGTGESQASQLVPQRRDGRTVALESGQVAPIEFQIRNLDVGTHQGWVEIVGQDGLPWDDRRFFTVEVTPAWRILVAAPNPADRYALFLTEMLAPTQLRRTGEARFECDVIDLGRLANTALERYGAVFLVDPTALEEDVWRRLGDYVSAGRGVAVFLGRNARSVESFNRPAAQELLAGKLLRQARRPDGSLYLAPRHLEHPILAAFRDLAESVPWQLAPVYRYWQLDEPAGGVHVVVPFSDGAPAILERPLGRGRAVTMTTPVSDDPNRQPWNLLPVESWPFFMLANEMASYLVGSKDRQLNYFAGQTVTLQLDPEKEFRTYVLAPLDSDAPEVRLTPDLRRHMLTVTSTDDVGNYRVQAGGIASGVDLGFSVNLASAATELDRLSDEELAELFGPVPYRVARNRHQLEGDRTMQRVGRELFPLLIALLALTLGLEHVLSNRFYRE
jgi:hypothetical protein